MTTAEIDRLLAERGIRYDVSDEEFYDGNWLVELDELLYLLPELSLKVLASYADAKCARLRFNREPEPDDEGQEAEGAIGADGAGRHNST